MIKVAFLGFGGIAQAHYRAYKELQSENFPVQISAFCDIREERLNDLKNANLYTSVDEMLAKEKDLDYVDICLPSFLHAEWSIKCMEAGFNVLCEKPMGLNEAETAAVIECRDRAKKKLMIAQCNRFVESIQIVRKFIMDGTFGKPKTAFFYRAFGRPSKSWNNWFWDKSKSGGVILDLGIHDVDMVNWMFGMPKAVSVAYTDTDPGNGHETVIANHMYDSGLIVNTYADWTVEHNKHLNKAIRINFERGYIFHDRTTEDRVIAVDENGNERNLAEGVVSKDRYRNEIEYFAESLIHNRGIPLCTPESAADAVKICRAQIKSAEAGGALVTLK